MKKSILLLFTLLLSTSCNLNKESSLISSTSTNYFNPFDYIKYLEHEDLKSKIENKEDFIYVISMTNCPFCIRQFNDIYEYIEEMPIEINIHQLDDMFTDLELDLENNPIKGEEAYNKAKEEYRYYAKMVEATYNYQYPDDKPYFESFYTERFNEGKELSLVYPVTFIFLDGEFTKELSYAGYGWTEDVNLFKSFLSTFKTFKGVTK